MMPFIFVFVLSVLGIKESFSIMQVFFFKDQTIDTISWSSLEHELAAKERQVLFVVCLPHTSLVCQNVAYIQF